MHGGIEPPLRGARSAARWFTAAACAIACVAAATPGESGFTTGVTAGLVASYARQFGNAARERIGAWVDFAQGQKGSPRVARLLGTPGAELDALQAVNSFFNRLPYQTDAAHWGSEDYWATPAEMAASNGGDCEDYSIAKYFLLREMGVPVERLRITYVKAVRLNQAHMVLTYCASPGAEPLILDNLEGGVRAASERADLVPVYSFNDEDVILVRVGRRASSQQIRAWRDCATSLKRKRAYDPLTPHVLAGGTAPSLGFLAAGKNTRLRKKPNIPCLLP